MCLLCRLAELLPRWRPVPVHRDAEPALGSLPSEPLDLCGVRVRDGVRVLHELGPGVPGPAVGGDVGVRAAASVEPPRALVMAVVTPSIS